MPPAGALAVLHLSASFPRATDDSTAPFLLDLLRAQRDAGWDPAAVAGHDAGLPTRQVLDDIPVRRARYGPDRAEVLMYRGGGHGGLRSPLHALLLPGLVLSLWWATWREVRRRRPDVLHAHWILPGGLVAALVPKGGARLVVTLHGNDVELAASKLAGPVARWAIRRTDALCAVSEPLARRAETILGLPAGTVTVARLPLPPGLHPTPLPDPPLRLLAAGRASVEKGFDILVAALARPEAAGWRATLVTAGPERPRLEAEAAAAGLGDRVGFTDLVPRDRLFDLVRDHHLVAVPSRSEGLGLFAVEALALGRPVVASRVGGLVEVVVDGDDGALVAPGDPAALAVALGAMAADLRPPVATAAARHTAAAIAADHAAPYGVDPGDPSPSP